MSFDLNSVAIATTAATDAMEQARQAIMATIEKESLDKTAVAWPARRSQLAVAKCVISRCSSLPRVLIVFVWNVPSPTSFASVAGQTSNYGSERSYETVSIGCAKSQRSHEV